MASDAEPAPSRWRPWEYWQTLLILPLLYLGGLAHWVYYLDSGNILFTSFDWPKEYKYYAVLRQALQTGVMPYHVDEGQQGTDRFLAIPETNLMPQVLLLPFLDTGPFFLVNVCILYSVGFIGLRMLARRYRLSWIPFTFLFLLFNFNGTLTARLAVGHSMWCGHFLLPFYFLYLLELADAPTDRTALKLAASLFAIFLSGAFHHFVWCAMFLGLLLLFQPTLRRAGLLALGAAALLTAFRILPAAITFAGDHERRFISGYPTWADLIQSIISLHPHTHQPLGRVCGEVGWWELDIYLSLPGFLLLFLFGVLMRFSSDPALAGCRFARFDGPIVVQSLLSMFDTYGLVATLPIPLLNGERVSSRFLIVPVMLLTIIGAVRMQRVLEAVSSRGRLSLQVGLGATLLATAFMLAQHSDLWRIDWMRSQWNPAQWTQTDPDVSFDISIIERPDPQYIAVLGLSAAISAAAWVAWICCYRRPERLQRLHAFVDRVARRWSRKEGLSGAEKNAG